MATANMHQEHTNLETEPSLAPYQTWFERYTAAFMNAPRDETVEIKLKIDHSQRVLENGSRIARTLDLQGMDLLTAEIAALFHDVGRFPQFARYKTFRDADSANHGRLGAKTLAGQPVLHSLPTSRRKQVLGAVYCHNMHVVPSHLPPELDRLVRIVRDADKLDILGIFVEHVKPGGLRNEKITLSLKDDPNVYSPETVAAVSRRQPVAYDSMVYVNDMVLSLCGWIYDLNFEASYEILQEKRQINTLLSFLPQTREIVRLERDMAAFLAGRRP